MIVIVTKKFTCAPLGHTVESFYEGEEIEGKAAEIALKLKCGKKKEIKPKIKKPAKPKITK